jgi:2',3'-cyclic-nucleotide 2'-phosphodiesterase/3'-nucleotidase
MGESLSAMFDCMEYDAVSIGNHEFDWGLEQVIDSDKTMRDYTYNNITYENKIPVICSNLYQNEKKYAFSYDYRILTKKAIDPYGNALEVKIGVIGFADDYGSSINNRLFKDLGYEIKADKKAYKALNNMAKQLENEGKCDATIVLSHGAADDIGKKISEDSDSCIDLVLGGHTHKNLIGRIPGTEIRYMEPTNNALAYCYCELCFISDGSGQAELKKITDDSDNAKIISTSIEENFKSLTNQYNNSSYLDMELIARSDYYSDITAPLLNEEIGYVTTSITKNYIEGSGKRCTVACNWLGNALISATGADVNLMNTSGARSEIILDTEKKVRTVTYNDLYSMLPFDDEVYLYTITYEELLDVFNYSMTNSGRGLMKSLTGLDCVFMDDPTDDLSDRRKYKRTIVTELRKDDITIWKDGNWTPGWKDKKLKLVVNNFIADNERISEDGINNPLATTLKLKRVLLEKEARPAIMAALKTEAELNDGLLNVDLEPHFKYIS